MFEEVVDEIGPIRHSNMMTGKAFNVSDECASRCVHLSPYEDEYVHLFFLSGQLNVHIWQHSKFTENAN